jgi:site-specific recombinase
MHNIVNQLKQPHLIQDPLQLLADLVATIRPGLSSRLDYSVFQFNMLVKAMEREEVVRTNLRQVVLEVIGSSVLGDLLVAPEQSKQIGFFSAMLKRIGHKFLPPLEQYNTLRYKLGYIFSGNSDYAWMTAISAEQWVHFFTLLDIKFQSGLGKFELELAHSLEQLSIRLSALSFDDDLLQRETQKSFSVSPFVEQLAQLQPLIYRIKTQGYKPEEEDVLNQIDDTLNKALNLIEEIQTRTHEEGTSFEETVLFNTLRLYIHRIQLIIDFFDERRFQLERFVLFLGQLVYRQQTRNSVRAFISENISTIAYEVAEHKSHSGEHYIATTRSEYHHFFVAAMQGGVIIAFVVLVKLFIHRAGFAPFWEAMAYSLNYALGFILIHVTGSSLATKQPAMTASALAASLDSSNGGQISLRGLAIATARVFRSQTVSFVGNLLTVFPFTLLLYYIAQHLFGAHLVDTKKAAVGMFYSNYPLTSLSLFYAGITGFFLFLSGIISGYVDTRVIFDKVPQRIREHPRLVKWFSTATLHRLAAYADHNAGAIVGNIMLGFFLGTASFIGFILGLPYDIRHITIASGNYIISAFELFDDLSTQTLLIGLIGVLGIGFVNFLVSFSLAFYVGVKSRKVSLRDYRYFSAILWRYIKKYPMDFVFPPKQIRKEEEL